MGINPRAHEGGDASAVTGDLPGGIGEHGSCRDDVKVGEGVSSECEQHNEDRADETHAGVTPA